MRNKPPRKPRDIKVFIEHPTRRTDRKGRRYVTLGLRWKRPSGVWAKVNLDNILLPDDLAAIIATAVAFPLDEHLQGGGDANEETVRKAIERALDPKESRVQ